MTTVTHEVLNQSTPWSGVNLYDTNRPLQDALRCHAPDLDVRPLQVLGGQAGSAAMQLHARLANAHKPVL
jgi:putative acyl-CoA dehydrogenase